MALPTWPPSVRVAASSLGTGRVLGCVGHMDCLEETGDVSSWSKGMREVGMDVAQVVK